MNAYSLKLPNLVTRFQKNPVYGSQTALYTRFTPQQWYQKEIMYCNEANLTRNYSEKIRNKAIRVMRDAEEKIQYGQDDTGRRLGERITDVTFWRNEVASELERLIEESEKLQDCRRVLEKGIQDIENPLHIAEECLYHRESRKGTEHVYDETEKCLLNEINNLKTNQKKLEDFLGRCKDQLRNCRDSQNQLQLDLKNKESALGIDILCHQLNNYSHGLEYYSRTEKYDSCILKQDVWIQAANRIIQKSQAERALSCQLRTDSEILLNRIGQEMWDNWTSTNNALAHRNAEMLEAKNKLQQHLYKLQQEIFDVEKNMELMRKAIADKSYALKVAFTRLQARMHRPELELCCDNAHISLQNEVDNIDQQIELMQKVLKETENQHQRLLHIRQALEHDLALKIDAMYVDREKVCGLRRAYPLNAVFRF